MQNRVVEWAPFKVREDVIEAELIAASEALQSEFLAKQPGFISRDLLRGTDDEWIDLVLWTTRSAADDAVKRAAESAVCFRYFSLMKGTDHSNPGGGVYYYSVVRTFGRSTAEHEPELPHSPLSPARG